MFHYSTFATLKKLQSDKSAKKERKKEAKLGNRDTNLLLLMLPTYTSASEYKPRHTSDFPCPRYAGSPELGNFKNKINGESERGMIDSALDNRAKDRFDVG